MSQILWFMPEIPGMVRQEDCPEYESNLGYVNSRLTKAMQQALLPKKQANKQN